eukprot:1326290-Amphidinium_carterae.1
MVGLYDLLRCISRQDSVTRRFQRELCGAHEAGLANFESTRGGQGLGPSMLWKSLLDNVEPELKKIGHGVFLASYEQYAEEKGPQ